jgi:hypothetical protein
MIYSKRNPRGRKLKDREKQYITDPFFRPSQNQVAGESLSSQILRSRSNPTEEGEKKGKKGNPLRKGKPRKKPRSKGKTNQPSSFAETQINPAFGLPAVAFATGAMRRPPVGAGSIVPRNTNNALSSLAFAKDIADKIGGTAAAATQAVESVKAFDKATGISKRVKDRRRKGGNGDGDNGGGGGGPTNLTSPKSGGYSYDMICNKPISQKIEISTGVRSGLIVNPGEKNNNDDFSSLYIMCGNLFKKDSVDTAFKDHLEKNIYPDVNREIQYNLNFDYELSLSDFNDWFYDMTKALEVYYALDSIDTYGKKDDNNNPGSRYLHTKITSSIRLKLNELRRALNYQAIPPRLLQTVRYMYQYYKFSELPGAPLYRLSPGFILHDSAGTAGTNAYLNGLSVGMLDELITRINSHTQVHNKIFKAMTNWHVPDYCMPPSCDTAYYDPNFRTFWFNSSLTYKSSQTGDILYTREGEDGHNFRYWLYSNNFDGLFFALGSFRKATETGTRPGLWTPANDFAAFNSTPYEWCNALCYNVNDTVSVISQTGAVYGRALQFDNIYTPYKHTLGGSTNMALIHNQDGSTQVAQECTFNTYRQAVWEIVEWLFTM